MRTLMATMAVVYAVGSYSLGGATMAQGGSTGAAKNVVLVHGAFADDSSAIVSPSPINYLAVRLKAGERWRYLPPAGHTVLWTAVASGTVSVPDELRHGDLAAFEPSSKAAGFEARTDAEFVVGSAVPHRYDLVLGSHSVHTTLAALREAQAHISAIRRRLVQEGRL